MKRQEPRDALESCPHITDGLGSWNGLAASIPRLYLFRFSTAGFNCCTPQTPKHPFHSFECKGWRFSVLRKKVSNFCTQPGALWDFLCCVLRVCEPLDGCPACHSHDHVLPPAASCVFTEQSALFSPFEPRVSLLPGDLL